MYCATNDTSDLVSSEIKYFIILNSYYEKKYEDVSEKIDEYLEKYPNTKHRDILLLLLARSYEALTVETKNECKKYGLPVSNFGE